MQNVGDCLSAGRSGSSRLSKTGRMKVHLQDEGTVGSSAGGREGACTDSEEGQHQG